MCIVPPCHLSSLHYREIACDLRETWHAERVAECRDELFRVLGMLVLRVHMHPRLSSLLDSVIQFGRIGFSSHGFSVFVRGLFLRCEVRANHPTQLKNGMRGSVVLDLRATVGVVRVTVWF